ncbi:caspase family protein [Bradyrhizobium sp.]|jgi:hypothetical protein|uniref:caspase family protein n=1 Tax=Bradyrhizobium sp. TaxID=376 RepID=UPI002E02CD07|nr:hypothetical protein [Bradyrhizobium sp.]
MPYPDNLSFKADSRIVLIGTSKYPSDESNLPPIPHAERNIDALSRLFKDPDICGLDESCIIRMLDRENASDVTSDLARIAQEATDTLLVYYVGHGLYGDADNPLYLATTKTTERGKVFDGIAISLVKKAMRSSTARKRILILDCCYSGRAMEGGMSAGGPTGAAEPSIDVQGTYGIAAVPASAKALAPPDEKLTRFTGALVEVLEHGLQDKTDRTLTLENVFDEVERRVRKKGDAPPPKRINWDDANEFRLAFNRALAAPSLKELQAAVTGLRETMKVTGLKVESLEAKSPKIDEVLSRVAALEAELSKNDASSAARMTASIIATPIWEYAGLPEDKWTSLPADPYKLHIKDCQIGNRYGLYFMMGACYLALVTFALSFVTRYPPRSSLDVAMVSLQVLSGLLTFALFFLLIFMRKIDSHPPFIRELMISNDVFLEKMRTGIVKVFGVPIQGNYAWLSVLIMAVATSISVLITNNKMLSP